MANDWSGIGTGLGALGQAIGGYADMKRQKAREESMAKQQEFENQLALQKMGLLERGVETKERVAANPLLGSGMTPGRKAADMAFGKDYVDWSTQGFANAQKGLQSLREAQAALASGANVSGGIVGKTPDWLRTITNPQAVSVKENIRSAVMNTLRATLGSQFTEKEGERIFNLAYNEQLPEGENLKRLKRITDELEAMAAAKQDLSSYFEQTGTTTGWKGRMPVVGPAAEAPASGGSDVRSRLAALRAKRGQK